VLGATLGKVSIAGHDLVDDWLEARRCLGYMPEAVPLYPEMRVVEYLRFRAELKQVASRSRERMVAEAMDRAGVIDMAERPIAHLSKGYRQRVGIADAIVGKPPVVILDEPTAGLDPNQIRHARELVRELGREHAVIVSTHILGEVEACATRVVLIDKGKLVAQGTPDELRAMRRVVAVELAARGDAGGNGGASAVADLLRSAAVAGVAEVHVVPSRHPSPPVTRVRATFAVTLGDAERTEATEGLVAALVRAGLGVSEVRAVGGSLEDVFAALTQQGEGEGGGGGQAN
jgi:ABC-2 type transport system ATP-binding protein